jgi:hypothetical protein
VGAGEAGWVLWALPTERPVSFPASRKLARVLQVLSTGVVPLHAVRADGWRATLTMFPVIEEMPAWLVTVLGGR